MKLYNNADYYEKLQIKMLKTMKNSWQKAKGLENFKVVHFWGLSFFEILGGGIL